MKKAYVAAGIAVIALIVGLVAVTAKQAKPVSSMEAVTPVPTPTKAPVTQTTSEVTPTSVPSQTTMNVKQYASPPPVSIDPTKSYTATITTDKGAMIVNLFTSEDPMTVNNFVFLARDGFYTNTIFHRVIKGFMIQGGDPLGTGMGGPGYKFADEKITRDYTRGTIAMANSGPNTNGSQFFIMHADNALPKNYVIFGTINPSDSASLATLDAIASAPVTDNGMGEDSKPVIPTVLQSIQIIEK